MVRGGPSLADRLIFLLTLLFLNTEGCCQLSSSWTNSCDGQIMFKQHMFCYKYYECVSSSWTEKSCSPGTYWMSDTQPCGSTTCFGTGSFEAETQGTGYTIRDMGGTTSDMGDTIRGMEGATSDMGDTIRGMGGTTSDMGGTTSDMGGTTSDMGGTTSVMGGTTSGTTVALSGITQSGNTRPPVPGATLYQLEDNVRVWTCDQPDSVWSNQRNTLLVFPWDTTWDNPGNCTAGYSDSQPCSTPDPPQQLIDATFRETLSRESGEVYALYYQCDNGLEVYSPVIGILLLCVDGTWFPASNDSCISDSEEDIIEGSGDEGEAMTASEVLQKLEEAWITERISPTLERHQSELVDCMLDQINQMTENLKRCKKHDFRLAIHKMEIDRIRYIISSYLRVRLEKIERFAHYLLEKEANTTEESLAVLSPHEVAYARDYISSLESHFQSLVLQHVPENLRTFDAAKMSVKPNMDSYIFLRAKQETQGVLLEDETGEGRDEEVDLEEGSQHLMRYKPISHLLHSGAVTLI